jgi:hypothetical protein
LLLSASSFPCRLDGPSSLHPFAPLPFFNCFLAYAPSPLPTPNPSTSSSSQSPPHALASFLLPPYFIYRSSTFLRNFSVLPLLPVPCHSYNLLCLLDLFTVLSYIELTHFLLLSLVPRFFPSFLLSN